ncbi:helix-turn-helix domain-containing protein [Methanoplanus endosymbiosus]|uniref:Helix-turn-helix domain-containing protein n=1 Tax=Methanoplanus endosymbiosus TaxID=33865 RepID=A0A9E7TK92_9EURY|nr:helix-turn-helix transcriptional regulator [Methanoplanus endosymbiosus]UUX92534.1 helix-turn-helix domain-containing protein [Methanoplanus endosymbiosus]
MDEILIFGELVKDIRLRKGLSQEKLAEKTSLDRTFISLIETGKSSPTLLTILKISGAFGLAPSELMLEFEKRLGEAEENKPEKTPGGKV